MVVLGGAKVADKFDAIGSLIAVADRILVGGAMAFPFLAAQGDKVGTSLLEASQVDAAASYLEQAALGQIELPSDVVVAAEPAGAPARWWPPTRSRPTRWAWTSARRRPRGSPPPSQRPGRSSGMARWAMFELAPYAGGTRAVARAMTDGEAFTVVGGGDTGAAIRALGFAEDAFGYVSTGGGASLEFIQGKILPGLAALEQS